MIKAITLRHVKEHNADPLISFNLKFRNNDLNMYKVGYVLGYTDGSFRYVPNKAQAERTFATEAQGIEAPVERESFNEPGGHY